MEKLTRPYLLRRHRRLCRGHQRAACRGGGAVLMRQLRTRTPHGQSNTSGTAAVRPRMTWLGWWQTASIPRARLPGLLWHTLLRRRCAHGAVPASGRRRLRRRIVLGTLLRADGCHCWWR